MPTETKNETKVDPKSKLLYVTLAIPLIGATIALSFGDPACLQNIGDDTTTVTSTDVDTTSTTVTSDTTTSTSSATSDVTSTTSTVTSDTESTGLDSTAG